MFVTLEGIDRSGKTTQAALLAEALGPETLLLREPGGTEVAERIRELLKDPAIELDPRAELLLFCAARAELCARVVRPALDGGRDVVCDRFIDSTVAYQGAARGLGVGAGGALNEIAIAGCVPDVTVLLRIDRSGPRPAASSAWRGAAPTARSLRGRGDRVPAPVAAAYDELAARHPERIVVDRRRGRGRAGARAGDGGGGRARARA